LATKPTQANSGFTLALPKLSERLGIFESLGAFARLGRLRREDSLHAEGPEPSKTGFSEREVSLGAVWGMFGETLLLLSAVFLLVIVIFFLHHTSSKALLSHIEEIRADLAGNTSSTGFNLDEMKEDLLDMVHETIGNMQPPNAIDHLLGALAGPIQMWAMRKAGIDPATGQAIQTVLPDLQEAFQSQD